MATPRRALRTLLTALALAASGVRGDEPKAPEPKAPEPPRILAALPLGVEAGAKASLTLRGVNLTNASGIYLSGLAPAPPVTLKSRAGAEKVEGFEPARVGDQQVEVEFTLPTNAPSGANLSLVASNIAGLSPAFPLMCVPAGKLVTEKEPNNGFREAQAVGAGVFIRGALESPNDVDVIQLEVSAGKTLEAEVFAERLGSTLDASLTLFDPSGAILEFNDDQHGKDPFVAHKFAKAGKCLIAVTSVNEKAGKTHHYLLSVRIP